MESSIDEVKKKIDIVELIGATIPLKKVGRNFKGLCPFHQEKTPSFIVSPERQIWHCFGSCGEGGDAIQFAMKWNTITFSEALQELADKAGVQLKKVDFEDKEWSKKQRLLKINLLIAEYYEYLLQKTPYGEKAREYLANRKITLVTAKKFRIGYAPSSWNSLITFLQKKKYFLDEMHEVGVTVKNSQGHSYDRFRGRLMFPINDVRGNIIGFSGRLLEKTAQEAKYINTPETLLYHKRETLYGIHLAKDAIKKENNVLIVEGEFDVISPYQQGIEHIVAIKGSAVTRDQLMLLKRYTSRITLALDMDAAGEEAIKRAIEESEELDLETNVVQFNQGKDPDEFVRTDPVAFKKAVQKPISLYDFVIHYAFNKYPGNDAYAKKKVGDEVVPFLTAMRNPIVKSYYIKKLATLLQISEESIQELMKRVKIKKLAKRPFAKTQQSPTVKTRDEVLQKYLVSMLFQSDRPYEVSEKIYTLIHPEDFSIPSLQKIYLSFLNYRAQNPQEFQLQQFVHTLPIELQSAFDEIYLLGSHVAEFGDVKLERLILEAKKHTLKKKIEQSLGSGDNQKDADLIDLTTMLKEVENKITKL